MKRRNLVALGIGFAAVAGAVAWALRPQPVTVETAEVTRGSFEQTVSDDGKTRVRDRYVVSAPLVGRVERIRLKAGDPVAEGQVVAVLTPTAPAFLDARAERELNERVGAADAQQLRSAAETQKAEAQLAQARADRDRSARLASGGFVSATAREQSELSVRTAEKGLEAAKFAEHAAGHEADQARAALARFRGETAGRVARGVRWEMKSPVRGSVLRVIQESEGTMTLGAPLLEVADPRSLEAVVDVLSQDSVSIRPGMPARLEIGAGVAPLAARVRRVEPAAFTKVSALGVEEQRVNVARLRRLARPRATLGDGYR
jgi:HlyD family secretion protein